MLEHDGSWTPPATKEDGPGVEQTGPERRAMPLLERTDHSAPSILKPENMLREARRQKGLAAGSVPAVCILDPDGDIVLHLRQRHGATRSVHWACYHTEMWEWLEGGNRLGIVGCAVGSSFSVLVAEQLSASGCSLILSLASAGQIADDGPPPYYILVERALRDEGTSHHYLPATRYAECNPELFAAAKRTLRRTGLPIRCGATWTTDAPFRETAETVIARRSEGVLAVEMEAAALYAFAKARGVDVLCLAHVSNQLGQIEGDFEKGHGNGAVASLRLLSALAEDFFRSNHRNPAAANIREGAFNG
jgi:uridine phosphorylase